MNISRIALLSALISAPMFAVDTTAPKTTDKEVVSTEAKAGMVAAVTAFMAARKENGLSFLDFFANWSCNIPLKKLATFECLKGGKFENSITPAGRVIVSAAFLTALYAAYNAYNAQDVDTDEDIFGDEDDYANLG